MCSPFMEEAGIFHTVETVLEQNILSEGFTGPKKNASIR